MLTPRHLSLELQGPWQGFANMPYSLARDDMKPADAGLTYVECSGRGWTRKPYGNGFTYQDADGNTLTGEDRERAEALVLPPAWTDVWICEKPDGHLQATGVDEAGRVNKSVRSGARSVFKPSARAARTNLRRSMSA